MAVFSLTDSVVTNQDIVSHNLELGQVVSYASKSALNILDTKTNLVWQYAQVLRIVATEDQKSIFSYLHPGCIIHQWDVTGRTVLNR